MVSPERIALPPLIASPSTLEAITAPALQEFTLNSIRRNMSSSGLLARGVPFPDAWASYSAADNRPMPVFTQSGQRWSNQPYHYSGDPDGAAPTIADAGCGVASLSMVLSWAHGRQITPDQIAPRLVAAGAHVRQGTTWEGIAQVARNYGYSAEVVHRPTNRQVDEALKSGPVIIMGPNNRNHIMVILDRHPEGAWLTVDPLPSSDGRSTGVGGISSVEGMVVIRPNS